MKHAMIVAAAAALLFLPACTVSTVKTTDSKGASVETTTKQFDVAGAKAGAEVLADTANTAGDLYERIHAKK